MTIRIDRLRHSLRVLQFSAVAAIAATAVAAGGGDGPCLAHNPSFEIGPGENGEPVAGWSNSGNVGRGNGLTAHGSWAAWLYGPFNGGAGISRLYLNVECGSGWQHRLEVSAGHRGADALIGAARAAFTVTWLDASGATLGADSVILLNADSPVNEMVEVNELLEPAPNGTSSMRLEFAFLQTAAQETGRAYIDAFQMARVNPSVYQWGDFGSTSLEFSDRTWRVKSAYTGPGPNSFSSSASNATVRPDGSLRLAINQSGSQWRCSEVVVEDVLGYGTYRFKTRGRLDLLDPNVVFGLFLWEYPGCYEDEVMWWNPPNEFDIEFSRWGQPGADVGQFVAQPYWWGGNISRFALPDPAPEDMTHEFRWAADGVYCRSWVGHSDDPTSRQIVHEWDYFGPHQPRPGLARIHLNLWLVNGDAPMNGQEQEISIVAFDFHPEEACVGDLNGDGMVDGADLGLLIGGWGAVGAGIGDLNGDELVDGADLGLMIGAWGECPD